MNGHLRWEETEPSLTKANVPARKLKQELFLRYCLRIRDRGVIDSI